MESFEKIEEVIPVQDNKNKLDSKVEVISRIRLAKPSNAFIGASWTALMAGIITYLIGLWNASMQLNEKGYYFTLLLFGLFSAVSLQKTVRDKEEGIPVTSIYSSICWFGLGASILLMAVGLWNAELLKSEKGFYAMSFSLSLFSAVTVQKNIRDLNQ